MSGATPILRPSAISSIELRQLTIARAEARIMTVVREELDKLRELNALPILINLDYKMTSAPDEKGAQVVMRGEVMDVRLRYV